MKHNRILITGAASGLGKALALCWAKHASQSNVEAKICVADIHDERGAETLDALKALGASAMYCHCDITASDDIARVRQQLIEEWGGVDVIINNAGVATGGSLASEPMSQWKWIFDINLFGMVQICQQFVGDFKRQGRGQIINIASQAGITPIPLMSSYNAVKGAVVSFSETLRLELAHDNINVSVVCPSFFKTNLDESMRSTEASSKQIIHKLFEKADMTAAQVAEVIYQQAAKNKFLIITHKQGRIAYLMKKLLPLDTYLKRVIKATTGVVQRSKKANAEVEQTNV